MTVRQIIYIDDERLRQRAKPVTRFSPNLNQLAQDMLETMRHQQGVGLAGPQIGVMARIFVAEIPADRDNGDEPHPQSGQTYILINPTITKRSQEMVEGQEGCLSMPTLYGLVERPERIEVAAQDLHGRKVVLAVDDLLARIFLHELDHLDGLLFTDHITDPEKLWQVIPEADQPD